eukprot:CAMPEP_0173457078 /NCGR_PEP_ID=MMETSP1357-20121228/57119_1 /TAXON_ID=77926 /ORGANISM="Hemiselmis rufescens, Strain PCC563" /LENGTH=52 /DNA_ID=CAMNT_0014424357 /DNA_START=1 /DNA_END=156 /DNA_ORIENTATION=+
MVPPVADSGERLTFKSGPGMGESPGAVYSLSPSFSPGKPRASTTFGTSPRFQ